MNFFVERGKESNPTATGDPLFQKGESHLTTFPRTRLFLLLTLRPLIKYGVNERVASLCCSSRVQGSKAIAVAYADIIGYSKGNNTNVMVRIMVVVMCPSELVWTL